MAPHEYSLLVAIASNVSDLFIKISFLDEKESAIIRYLWLQFCKRAPFIKSMGHISHRSFFFIEKKCRSTFSGAVKP